MGRKIFLIRLFDHRQHEVQTELHGSHHLSRTRKVSSIMNIAVLDLIKPINKIDKNNKITKCPREHKK